MDRRERQKMTPDEVAEMFAGYPKDGLGDSIKRAKSIRTSDVLSQKEIDNLLMALNEGEVDNDAIRIMDLKKDLKLINAYVQGWNDAIDRVMETGRK